MPLSLTQGDITNSNRTGVNSNRTGVSSNRRGVSSNRRGVSSVCVSVHGPVKTTSLYIHTYIQYHMYICNTDVRTYVCVYVQYVHTYVCMYIRMCVGRLIMLQRLTK